MGTSVLPYQFRFNGVVSTDKTVTQNFQALCLAAMCWVTYDSKLGKWAVVINRAGSSVASFDDSNIVGPISITGTGLKELYNSVRMEFPHVDLSDQTDYVRIEIPDDDRNPNELDNELNLATDILNDPVQAEYIAMVELKQNRLDKVITFVTDFSMIGLMAGDIIDVTNTAYAWDSKLFRVITINESDTDDGNINFQITALEYDDNIYSTDDLTRYNRDSSTGIRSLGAIDKPATPVLTEYTQVADPRVEIEAIVPDGVVNTMDLYVSQDSVNFTFVSSSYPEGGGAFETGSTVTYSYNGVRTGTLYAKIRASNSVAASEFSDVGSIAVNLQTRADLAPSGSFDIKAAYSINYSTGALNDRYTYSGTGYNAIVGNSAYMYGFNLPEGTSTPAFRDLEPGITAAQFKVNLQAITLGARSNPNGVAVFYNWAPWDNSLYQSGGLGALNWGANWWWLGSFKDDFGDLSGPNKFLSATGNGWVYPFDGDRMNGQPAVLIFGISTTIVPWVSDISVMVDQVSGESKASYSKPWSTNTVLIDGIGGSPTSYPGRSSGSPLGGGAAVFLIDALFYKVDN